MVRRRSLSSISLAQIMALVGLILTGYFIIGFVRVALVSYQLRNTKAALQAEIVALKEDVASLEAEKVFVQTDAYVEQAAREEYKLSQPGDKVVVPIFHEEDKTSAQEVPEPEESAASTPVKPWRAWWKLFFDQ